MIFTKLHIGNNFRAKNKVTILIKDNNFRSKNINQVTQRLQFLRQKK